MHATVPGTLACRFLLQREYLAHPRSEEDRLGVSVDAASGDIPDDCLLVDVNVQLACVAYRSRGARAGRHSGKRRSSEDTNAPRRQIYLPTRSCPSLSAQVMHLVAVSVA